MNRFDRENCADKVESYMTQRPNESFLMAFERARMDAIRNTQRQADLFREFTEADYKKAKRID